MKVTLATVVGLIGLITADLLWSQPPDNRPEENRPAVQPPNPGPPRPGEFRPEDRGPRPFPGGPGFGPQEIKVVEQFDKNGDGWLNKEERAEARKHLQTNRPQRPGPPGFPFPGGPPPEGFRPPREGEPRPEGFRPPGDQRPEGEPRPEGNRPPREGGPRPEGNRPPGEQRPEGFRPPGFPGRQRPPAQPGRKINPDEVQASAEPLYSDKVLRTLFFEFENQDWEAELQDFHGTDVEVPATLTVDGRQYPGVGIQFRGASSYMGVPAGYKRSLNVSVDFVDDKQRLYGYKTLNLLNSNDDPSFLSTVLYSHIARQYIPAPKANLVRVVVNGENWGLYVNVQQFNKELLEENYPSGKGTRWKVSGSPGGGGGLEYVGDDVSLYERRYEMKTDDPKAWKKLIHFCKVLNTTPPEELEAALEPILDIDATLKFLALDVALVNNDGYWIRASDYSIYLDDKGQFHMLPHDMNEAFRAPMGPGMGRGPMNPQGSGPQGPMNVQRPMNPPGPMNMQGPSLNLDPLIGLDDARKPLRSKLLAVPALRERYLQYVREIAGKSLNWEQLGPVVASYRALIEAEVKDDTRKLNTLEEFLISTSPEPVAPAPQAENPMGRPPRRHIPLKQFAEQRREYLLKVTIPEAAKAD